MLGFKMCSTGNLVLELEVDDRGEHRQGVWVVVFRSRDLFEVAMGEFGLSSCDNLQVCGRSIIFGIVFSIDLTYYEQ